MNKEINNVIDQEIIKNQKIISDNKLKSVVYCLLFAVILIPFGMVFLFTFSSIFSLRNDIISVSVLGWVILLFGFFWFLSIVSLLLCLALAFLQNEGSTTNQYQNQ